jgi:hypothetical protein
MGAPWCSSGIELDFFSVCFLCFSNIGQPWDPLKTLSYLTVTPRHVYRIIIYTVSILYSIINYTVSVIPPTLLMLHYNHFLLTQSLRFSFLLFFLIPIRSIYLYKEIFKCPGSVAHTVIPTIQEVEIRRILVEGQSRKKLARLYLNK